MYKLKQHSCTVQQAKIKKLQIATKVHIKDNNMMHCILCVTYNTISPCAFIVVIHNHSDSDHCPDTS